MQPIGSRCFSCVRQRRFRCGRRSNTISHRSTCISCEHIASILLVPVATRRVVRVTSFVLLPPSTGAVCPHYQSAREFQTRQPDSSCEDSWKILGSKDSGPENLIDSGFSPPHCIGGFVNEAHGTNYPGDETRESGSGHSRMQFGRCVLAIAK